MFLPSHKQFACSSADNSQLHVALVPPSWPVTKSRNGIVTYVATLEEQIRALGHETTILTRSVPGEDKCAPNVRQLESQVGLHERVVGKFHPFLNRRLRAIKAKRNTTALVDHLVQAASCSKIDLLELHDSFGLAATVAPRVAMPVVVRLHGPYFLTGPASGVPLNASFHNRVRAEGQALNAATAVTAPSQAVLDATFKRYGLDTKLAAVIPNPIKRCPSQDRWNPQNVEANSILFVGRFDRLKGGDLVLLAFDEVLKRFTNAKLYFIGPDAGIPGVKDEVVHCKEFIHQRLPSAAERIEFLGQQPPGEIGKYRKRAAVTVVASTFENFPNTVLEAFAYGCPTVATRVGGIPEIIAHRKTGILAQPNDPQDLANAICGLFQDSSFAAQLGAAAAEDACLRFSPDTIARQTVQFYRRVICYHDGVQRARQSR